LQRDLLRLLAARRERSVIVDAGANLGAWTASFLRARRETAAGLDFELHAFEPVPETYRALTANLLRAADADRVTPVPKALSSRSGEAQILTAGDCAGTSSLHEDVLRPGRRAERIELTTLDAYALERGFRDLHFVKSDTEGHDYEVILGARGLIATRRIWVMQFEYNHVWISSRRYLKDVFDLVAGHGYRIGKVAPERLEILPAWHPELERFFAANLVLLREDLAAQLRHVELRADASNTYA
jgi:FkbM family methyltransferase